MSLLTPPNCAKSLIRRSMGNGEKGHLATYSEVDSKNALPATSLSVASSATSINSIVLITTAVR